MEEAISFSKQYLYDTLKIGITLPITLTLNGYDSQFIVEYLENAKVIPRKN